MKTREITNSEKKLCREIASVDGVTPKEIEKLFVESGVIDLGILPSYAVTLSEGQDTQEKEPAVQGAVCDVCGKPLFWFADPEYPQWKHVDRNSANSPQCWGNPEPKDTEP